MRIPEHQGQGEAGIVIIHQELALVPMLSIGENMFLGNEQGTKFNIDWNETYGKADQYLKLVGLHENSHTLIKDLGVGKQQLVEIAKALAKDVKLLILDEPTATLNEEDSKNMHGSVAGFKMKGLTSIISPTRSTRSPTAPSRHIMRDAR
jgi:putative multiple sugar transport system ATP-binding protein